MPSWWWRTGPWNCELPQTLPTLNCFCQIMLSQLQENYLIWVGTAGSGYTIEWMGRKGKRDCPVYTFRGGLGEAQLNLSKSGQLSLVMQPRRKTSDTGFARSRNCKLDPTAARERNYPRSPKVFPAPFCLVKTRCGPQLILISIFQHQELYVLEAICVQNGKESCCSVTYCT